MELTSATQGLQQQQHVADARPLHLSLPKSRSIDVDFTDVTYTVRTSRNCTKRILHGVSGSFRSGELTAIMGPSGAGKSTLLNLLSGFQSEGMGGSVRTNGVPRDMAVFRKSSCYILQYDQLHPLFTVTEVLHMAASLKLGPGMTRKARQIAVENVIDALGLCSCSNTRAASLSGGQQKRLSIALEILDNPPVMFLDEPTTGLDSSSCSSCVELLVKLAQGGRTIVCTLHQPSAREFEMIDHVYVMAAGWCIYQGDSKQAVPFLNSVQLSCPKYHNPADFMLEIATGGTEAELKRLEEASSDDLERWRRPRKIQPYSQNISNVTGETTSMIMRAQKQGVSEWSKFRILFKRSCLQFSRDWTLTHLRLVIHILVSILFGLLFEGAGQDGSRSMNNLAFCFVTTVYLAYTAMMPAVLKFPAEMYVLRKERFNNWYSLRTYYSAFTAADTPLQVLFCAVYVSISYFLSSQAAELFRFSKFLFACILLSLLAESVGLLLGASVNQTKGTFIGAYSTALWLVLAGLLLMLADTPSYLRWTHYISYLHYAFEALAVSVYGYDRPTLICPEDKYCHLKYPHKILETVGFSDANYWLDILVLAGITVALRALTYWILRRRLNSLVC